MICTQGSSPLCLYRFGVADFLTKETAKDVKQRIALLLASDEANGDIDNKAPQVWYEAQKAGFQLVAIANEADAEEQASTQESSIRASLCFLQQLILQSPTIHPRDADYLLKVILNSRKA